MEFSFKRISICLILILTLAVSPIVISGKNSVHAAKQDDLAKVAKAKKGKTASHFGFSGGWCSQFVWWAAKEAGLMNGKTFPKKSVGGTNDIQRYFTKKGQYKKATSKFKPKKGDLAIFGSSRHVGIVTGVKGKYVTITHGNWSNKVCITKIKKSGYDGRAHARIKGYVRLNYLKSEPKIKIKFDTDGGEATFTSKKIRNTKKIGDLPEVVKDGYEFVGWYTNKGKKITKKSKIDVKKTITLYAKYEEITEEIAQ